jgi:hypothetical protein
MAELRLTRSSEAKRSALAMRCSWSACSGIISGATGTSQSSGSGTLPRCPETKSRPGWGRCERSSSRRVPSAGLSGSPVFVHMGFARWREGRVVQAGTPAPFFFLGIVHGHWDVRAGAVDAVAAADSSRDSVNAGVGIVVPAEVVMRVLNPIWKALLEARRRQLDAENAPTTDAVGDAESVIPKDELDESPT